MRRVVSLLRLTAVIMLGMIIGMTIMGLPMLLVAIWTGEPAFGVPLGIAFFIAILLKYGESIAKLGARLAGVELKL